MLQKSKIPYFEIIFAKYINESLTGNVRYINVRKSNSNVVCNLIWEVTKNLLPNLFNKQYLYCRKTFILNATRTDNVELLKYSGT